MREAQNRIRSSGGALVRLAAIVHAVTTPDVKSALYRIGRGETPTAQAASTAARARWSRPGAREKSSEQQRRLWQEPEHRARLTQARQKAVGKKSYRRTMERRAWKNPTARAKRSMKAKAAWQRPEFQQAITRARKSQWSDPAYRAFMLGVLARARAKRRELTS